MQRAPNSGPVAPEPAASELAASELAASELAASERVASEPVASEPVASEPVASGPDRPKAADAPEDNFMVRYLQTLEPAEAAVLGELAELDTLHGDEPTPPR